MPTVKTRVDPTPPFRYCTPSPLGGRCCFPIAGVEVALLLSYRSPILKIIYNYRPIDCVAFAPLSYLLPSLKPILPTHKRSAICTVFTAEVSIVESVLLGEVKDPLGWADRHADLRLPPN